MTYVPQRLVLWKCAVRNKVILILNSPQMLI